MRQRKTGAVGEHRRNLVIVLVEGARRIGVKLNRSESDTILVAQRECDIGLLILVDQHASGRYGARKDEIINR